MGMESENLTERFVAAVNSRTAEENARIMGVPVEDLLRAGFVDTPAGTERRKREFFRDLNDGARDGWRSVSLDHWVLLDGDNVMAWVSRVSRRLGEWGWRVARCNGGTDVTSGGPATLAGAKSAVESAMSLGSAYDLGLSRAWGQRWEAERERAREKTVAGVDWLKAKMAGAAGDRAQTERRREFLRDLNDAEVLPPLRRYLAARETADAQALVQLRIRCYQAVAAVAGPYDEVARCSFTTGKHVMGSEVEFVEAPADGAVSYTHLTLPTSDLV